MAISRSGGSALSHFEIVGIKSTKKEISPVNLITMLSVAANIIMHCNLAETIMAVALK